MKAELISKCLFKERWVCKRATVKRTSIFPPEREHRNKKD